MKLFTAKYLIRLDDACHQMPINKWNKFEAFFIENGIKPIIGVVPDNKDKVLGNEYDYNFWGRVRNWKNLGWSIAIHGLHHILTPIEETKTFFGFGGKSEFVGLREEVQKNILKKSLEIFKNNGITPEIFMAPSHAFDITTLKCLKKVSSIKLITDGFSFRPFIKDDFIFFPQQLWSVKKMPFGLFTICIHPTTMNNEEIETLLEKIKSISNDIISIDELNLKKIKEYNIVDSVFTFFYKIVLKYKFRP
ncbi:DUF2334 domain-containing protein [Flavobacteriaceae bacterium]|nr:DUF2334 domain-containing protein [Flavobacteriaceae bacterium]